MAASRNGWLTVPPFSSLNRLLAGHQRCQHPWQRKRRRGTCTRPNVVAMLRRTVPSSLRCFSPQCGHAGVCSSQCLMVRFNASRMAC